MRFALTLILAGLCAAPALGQTVTACDQLTGYAHTPRLPGLPGTDAIDDAAAAIAACEAELRRPDADPFFTLLLARAYEAADPQDPRLPDLIALGSVASAPFAASRLGLLYRDGHGGLAADPARSRALNAQSCAAFPDPGALAGCNNLAAALQEPAGRSLAAALFQRNCDAGFGLSCENLAQRLADEAPPADDPARQIALRDRACDLGSVASCSLVGYALEYGLDVPVDRAGAADRYRRGCEGGDAYGCYALGSLLTTATDASRDWARGQQLLAQGCAGGNDDACYDHALGLMYGDAQTGHATQPGEQAQAAATFERLCAALNGPACADLGYLMQEGIYYPQDSAQAVAMNELGCDLGAGMGCNNLGVHYGRGDGVAADPSRAAAYYTQACEQGIGLGCFNLGEMLAGAELGAPDPEAARLRFFQACRLGYTDACARVAK